MIFSASYADFRAKISADEHVLYIFFTVELRGAVFVLVHQSRKYCSSAGVLL